MIKALVLISGGLDSSLAAWLLKKQGIKVTGLIFKSPFFSPERGIKAAKQLEIDYQVVEIGSELLEIIKHPDHGYGGAANPCIDCHTLMLKKAKQIMEEEGYDFVATGEVLGQRPFSQNKQAMEIIAEQSGLNNKLLRPLSAQHLPTTLPEEKELVDKGKLLGIKGRGRKKQMEIAKELDLDYPQPAGGCMLTEQGFGDKLFNLLDQKPDAKVKDAELLKIGRHYWNSNTQIILGRDQHENQQLEKLAEPNDLLIQPANFIGPTALIRQPKDKEENLKKAKTLIKQNTPQEKKEPITSPLVFFGSCDESIKIIEELKNAGLPIEAVFTQPDRPAGRGQEVQPTPVAEYCQKKNDFTICKWAKLNNQTLENTKKKLGKKPIASLVAIYGNLIPQTWLNWAGPLINLHPSLLPKWRGAAPVMRAIEAGDKKTGITLFKIVPELDAGPIIDQIEVEIKDQETAGQLTQRLFNLGTKRLIKLLSQKLVDDKLTFWVMSPQDNSKATYAEKIDKQEAEIDWQVSTEKIKNKIYAFNPWPGAYTFVNINGQKKRLKIWEARIKDNKLIPQTVQLAGKKKNNWEQFSHNYKINLRDLQNNNT
jgi:methionyl-tRNA formyltransferase